MVMRIETWRVWAQLRREELRLEGQLSRVRHARREHFLRGVAAPSHRMRVVRAYRVSELDAEARAIQRMLQLVSKQKQILGHLVHARENRDPLDQGPLAEVYWEAILAAAAQSAMVQESLITQLDRILALLERPAPSYAPPPKPKVVRHATPLPGELAVVKHVPDGDGLKLADERRVRYIGMDAPEVSDWDGHPEPFAVPAKELNQRLVLGKEVRLVADTSDTDRYGRLLRYVYAGDTLVNAELVRAGLARALTVPPNTAKAELFERLEREAQQAGRGMWAIQ